MRQIRLIAAVAAALLLSALTDIGSASAQNTPSQPERKIRARLKVDSWKEYPTRILSDLKGFTPSAAPAKLDKYGGWAAHKYTATGFFHTQKTGDRWWLIDPEGHPFLFMGVVSVSPGKEAAMQQPLFKKRFETPEGWAAAATRLLKDNGFNGTGSWSSDTLLAKSPVRVAYTPNWNFMSSYGRKRGGTFQQPGHTGYPKDAIFVFDPGFAAFCDEHARQLAATKNDPYLVGHYSDNELPFPKDALDKFLSLPQTDAGGKEARVWLSKQRGGSPVTDIAAATKTLTLPEREAWRGYVADRYFDIVKKAIKKHDPNHLYLGPRLHGNALNTRTIMQAAGKHLDVIAANLYGVWNPKDAMQRLSEWSGKPIIVTEWYAKGDDSGLENVTGAGWTVATQLERGQFYQNFTLGLLESKGCVGWHWFKYMDNDPNDKAADASNQNSNKGIVNIRYETYTPLVETMKPLNQNAYSLADYFDGKKTPAASTSK
ncbi:MAG: hypothetical protein V4671_00745 [Armatimonadota bacterium]